MKKRKPLFLKLMVMMTVLALFKVDTLFSQDTVPKIIISEAHLSYGTRAYAELTNIGDTALNLHDFGFGCMPYWRPAYDQHRRFWDTLPEFILEPGESYLIAVVNDWHDSHEDPDDYIGNLRRFFTPEAILEHVDLPVFMSENPTDPSDSVSVKPERLLVENGWHGLFVDYLSPDGQVVCDAVNNDLDLDGEVTKSTSDVAGVLGATYGNILVRKTTVVRGNLDWEQAKGADAEDSEWIVLPLPFDYDNPRQAHFTTLKHHGNADITGDYISSSSISIDFGNGVMDVPWGIYRDSIMFEFDLADGLAWNYMKLKTVEDSLYTSVRTGDTLILWAVGESRKEQKFHINVLDPASDMNFVVPKFKHTMVKNEDNELELGYKKLFDVTENESGVDSIVDVAFGLRVDTLFAYLEKPSNAEWEIVWVDGTERPDLKYGDILKVTAENGTEKGYLIAAYKTPLPGTNASLASISWPDVPELTKLSPEWGEDIVIPMFNSSVTSYRLTVPYGMGIPALVATPEDVNVKIEEKRATNLDGDIEARTTVFKVTAEDNETVLEYSVLFEKEVPSIYLQPYAAKPIVSQMVFRQSNRMSFLEIANVGNQPIDLSKYMITYHRGDWISNPSEAITDNADEFVRRYRRFVYGYDFVQTAEEWAAKPGFLEIDSYDPFIEPGDVVVFAYMKDRQSDDAWQADEVDILMERGAYDYAEFETSIKKIFDYDSLNVPKNSWWMSREGGVWADPVHIFEIMNDSILEGKKGIGDPNDFELVDAVGGYANETWIIDGKYEIAKNHQTMIRKEQYWYADSVGTRGFDTIPEKNYWYYMDRDSLERLGFSNRNEMLADGIGSHVSDPVTIYSSTIKSLEYLASEGYTSPQTLIGVLTNTPLDEFYENIIKTDDDQTLSVISGTTGLPLAEGATVNDNDTLKVVSADMKNTTKYVISVDDIGLDDNAILEAKDGSGLTIEINGDMGTISGIEFGTTLQDVLDNIVKPGTAKMNVIDQDNGMVGITTIDSEGNSIPTMASHLISFEVIAQDNKTIIVYNLELDLGESDAVLFSDVYSVDQETKVIDGIEQGIRVPSLFTKVYLSAGASAKLFDKDGNERTEGEVSFDDVILVTSGDGSTVSSYYLQFMNEAAGTDAYVISDMLPVDQLEKTISEVQEGTTISELMSMLTGAPGSTVTAVDADGNEVSSGEITTDHMIKVVSGNEEIMVFYEISIAVSVHNLNLENICAYPNPAEDIVYITGLRKNSVVSLYNLKGQKVKIFEPKDIHHGRIDIHDVSKGLYFMTVKSGNYHLKTLEIIKK